MPGCGGDEGGTDTTTASQDVSDGAGSVDGAGTDAATAADTATAGDTAVADTATAEDTAVADTTTAEDTAVADTATADDTSVADTSVADTTIADTTVADTTVADTTVADTTVADTTIADTTVADTTVADTTVADTTADDTTTDTAPATPVGELVMEDQVLAQDYDTIFAKVANLPPSFTATGKLRVYFDDGAGNIGLLAGEAVVPFGSPNADLKIVLKAQIVGTQAFIASLTDNKGAGVLGQDGQPLSATFKVTGDTVDPVLTMVSQTLPESDLQTLSVSFVRVPARFTTGAWLAIYADNAGKIGGLLGKEKFAPGDRVLDQRVDQGPGAARRAARGRQGHRQLDDQRACAHRSERQRRRHDVLGRRRALPSGA